MPGIGSPFGVSGRGFLARPSPGRLCKWHGGYEMASQTTLKLNLESLRAEISLPEKAGGKGIWTIWVMPTFTGIRADRLELVEVEQLIDYFTMVRDKWPKN